MTTALPPLIPKVDAILVLDGDGNRLAGKYYGDFLTNITSSSARTVAASSEGKSSGSTVEDLRSTFERQLQSKIHGIAARPDAAEVVTVMGKTCVFCGGSSSAQGAPSSGGDVRVVHVGPMNESELVLAHLCEGMFEALSHLMGGSTDRTMVLDNLEYVFLLIDEHSDGGIILETDPSKLASSVLLRDEDPAMAEAQAAAAAQGGAPPGAPGMPAASTGDMTIAQAFRQAKEQLISNLAQRDGGM
uniref:Coatomer subunit zeta n=2 Tax=Odontella aurita TaxID=265563 RepID=A0A7S4JXK4_9STRA|mmetsp:Transcript_56353/g.168689  ORF Transcript_56353/g.168689 Transcript_56353/m.168689 type:complete len:245 (+) Transcript_56353:148-882(+)|eukprot:CAMPEP_0113543130 /NCGR_PEP_ID=MMETSP0015_2-20120614/9993_1 /TAXON_ID=2838 /ORGANISM="Odontella" /LENGTH=244 /DNA_ID=CAMNT_0000443267 /DNA_START=137 /DNA_END=871 /DNA_ORIENTATION=+ /assembly_acc=CAM_ASM_000160